MGGYIERAGPATGTHDPLSAKAVAFRRGETAAVLLAVDLLYVSHEWTLKLKSAVSRKIGAPPDNILIAATHTHSGPAAFSPMAGENERLATYEETLLKNCVEAAEEAYSSVEPSRLRVGSSVAEGVAGNRRDPNDATGGNISVVRVEGMRGKVKGHLVSFACHPTVMGPSNLEYSADLFGAAAARIEQEHDDSLCLMFNGLAGDISTRFVRREQTWAEVERLGGMLAERIIAASRALKPVDADAIRGENAVMQFPFREIPDPETAQKEYDKASKKAETADDAGNERLARSLVEGAAARVLLSRIGGWRSIFGTASAEMELQALRIGDVVVCGLPGEFFSKREPELRDTALPDFGFIIGYANGYWGYLVPPEEAAKGGYEAMMSPVDPEREPEIIQEAENVIRRVSREIASRTTADA